jgi:TatD DNase family protein
MIDTHSHILKTYYQDIDSVLIRAKEKNVTQLVNVAVDFKTSLEIKNFNTNIIKVHKTVGIHPTSRYSFKDLEKLDDLVDNSIIAIGETGLDLYHDKSYFNEQIKVFEYQIQLAIKHNLPLIIHSRDALNETLEVLARFPYCKAVIHCFVGNPDEAKKLVSLGYYLGIGGVFTYNSASLLRSAITKDLLPYILLETDCPYLSPLSYRGKDNEPSYMALTASKLANELNLSVDEIDKITTENAKKLFTKIN